MTTGLLPLDSQMKKGVGSCRRAGAAEICVMSICMHTLLCCVCFCSVDLVWYPGKTIAFARNLP